MGRELEFEPSTQPLPSLAESAFDIARFLIAQGPVFKDGDQIGAGSPPQWRITLEREGRFVGTPVFHLAATRPSMS